MSGWLCTVNPLCFAATTVTKATLGGIFDALTSWVLSSVQWLLSAAGHVLLTASEPTTVVRSATQEFNVLLAVSPLLLVLGLAIATLQALRHGDPASLWRVYLGVAPACVAGLFLARPLTVLILSAVNQLSTSAASTVVLHESTLANALTSLSPTTPGFGLFLLALGLVVGGFLLWCELIVRSVILTLLLVLVPLIVPLCVFPSLRRLGWRLAETFLAVASSKLLIVITLTLGFDELTGSSATQVITGAVTLLLATASPFVLLRVIPFVEQSAMHNVEGLRQRLTRSVHQAPSSPLGSAARALLPEVAVPGPPERPEDLGLEMWESGPDFHLAPSDGEPPPPPIGEPRHRGGHVAYFNDDGGPVVGWHFDE